MMFKGKRWWWFIVALGLIAAGLLVPIDAARQWLLPVEWIWPLAIWSSRGSREIRYGTHQLVFSAPYPLRRQLPTIWLAGAVVALVTGCGVVLNLALSGEWTGLLAWATAALTTQVVDDVDRSMETLRTRLRAES